MGCFKMFMMALRLNESEGLLHDQITGVETLARDSCLRLSYDHSKHSVEKVQHHKQHTVGGNDAS